MTWLLPVYMYMLCVCVSSTWIKLWTLLLWKLERFNIIVFLTFVLPICDTQLDFKFVSALSKRLALIIVWASSGVSSGSRTCHAHETNMGQHHLINTSRWSAKQTSIFILFGHLFRPRSSRTYHSYKHISIRWGYIASRSCCV